MNRFNQFTNRDYSFDTFIPKLSVPNFQMWDSVLAAQEQRYSDFQTGLQKNPTYLQTDQDRELFKTYRDKMSGTSDLITDAYMKQGVDAGNRLMTEKAREIQNEWNPGGLAHTLTSRYNSYTAEAKRIQDELKDETNPANLWFAKKTLEEQLKQPIGYNPQTGEALTTFRADTYKSADIKKQIDQAVKDIEESGTTTISGIDRYVIEKVKTEGKSPEALQSLTEALLALPQNQKQLAIETSYKGSTTTDSKQQYETELKSIVDKERKMFENPAALDPQSIRNLQHRIGVRADGVWGQESQKKADEYIKTLEEKANTKKNEFTPEGFAHTQVLREYVDYARSKSNLKVDRSVQFNDYLMHRDKMKREDRKNDIDAKRLEYEMKGNNSFIVTPDVSVSGQTFDQMMKNKTTALNATTAGFKTALTKYPQFGGMNEDQILLTIAKYNQSGRDPSKFSTGMGAEKDKALFEFLSGPNGSEIRDIATGMQRVNFEKQRLDKVNGSMVTTYAQTPEGKTHMSSLYSTHKLPGETMEQFQMAFSKAVSDKDVQNLSAAQRKNIQRFIRTSEVPADPMSGGSLFVSIDSVQEYRTRLSKSQKKNPELYKNGFQTYTFDFLDRKKGPGKIMDTLAKQVEMGDVQGFRWEDGIDTPVWRTADGKEKAVTSFSDVQFLPATGNNTGFKVLAKGKVGNSVFPVVSYVQEIPETMKAELLTSFRDMQLEAVNNGNQQAAALAAQYVSNMSEEPSRYALFDAISTDRVGSDAGIYYPRSINAKTGAFDYFDQVAEKSVLVEENVPYDGALANIYKTGDAYVVTVQDISTGRIKAVPYNENGNIYHRTPEDIFAHIEIVNTSANAETTKRK